MTSDLCVGATIGLPHPDPQAMGRFEAEIKNYHLKFSIESFDAPLTGNNKTLSTMVTVDQAAILVEFLNKAIRVINDERSPINPPQGSRQDGANRSTSKSFASNPNNSFPCTKNESEKHN
jgi:hypothetical protein